MKLTVVCFGRCMAAGWTYNVAKSRCEPARDMVKCASTVPVALGASQCTNTSFDASCTVQCGPGYTGAVATYVCDINGVWQNSTAALTCTGMFVPQ